MKTMKAKNKEAHGESEGKTEEASGFFTPNEKSDFRAVKVKDCKAVPKSKEAPAVHLRRRNGHGPHDFKRHPRLLRAGRADRKDPDCDHEPAAAPHDGH